jgi:hypothetical protein
LGLALIIVLSKDNDKLCGRRFMYMALSAEFRAAVFVMAADALFMKGLLPVYIGVPVVAGGASDNGIACVEFRWIEDVVMLPVVDVMARKAVVAGHVEIMVKSYRPSRTLAPHLFRRANRQHGEGENASGRQEDENSGKYCLSGQMKQEMIPFRRSVR